MAANVSRSPGFTASQIAAALGRTRQRVVEILRGTPADGAVIASGNPTATWETSSLPASLQTALSTVARRKGYSCAEDLLSCPAKRWMPPVPLPRVAEVAIASAETLRSVLVPVIGRYCEATREQAGEVIAEAVDAYEKLFRRAVSHRHMRRLIDRTVERDRGFMEWGRIEIYLDDRPELKAVAPAESRSATPRLSEAIEHIVNPAEPSRAESELMWFSACEDVAALADQGLSRSKAIAAAVAVLANAPGLCGKSQPAIEKALRRRLARWEVEGGELCAVQDRRAENGHAHGRLELSKVDRETILKGAITSSLSAAWHKLMTEGGLSADLVKRYSQKRYSKSYVPTAIREELQPVLDALQPHRRGPRAAALAGAFINRDPSGMHAGDVWQGDDLTSPVKYYVRASDGTIEIVRGQLLVMICVRSLMVLGFVLISDRHYNAFHIRNLITRCADEHGLPRKGFYFESGIWKEAKLLKGAHNERPWAETEHGLMSLGLRFQHARWPRGKVVERILGILQDRMEGMLGYCGRDEKKDVFERVKRNEQLVRAGKLEPSKVFMSETEWYAELVKLMNVYNETPQEGKYCGGRCPREVYEQTFGDPVIKLSGSVRYLLATHRMREKVTGNGITIRFGKQVFRYKGDATGRFIGRQVECFFNPEAPDTLSFLSPASDVLHTVAREISVPAWDAPRETLSAALSQNDEHNRPMRELYRSVAPEFSSEFRTRRFRGTLADETSMRIGEAIATNADAVTSELAAEQRSRRSQDNTARAVGIQEMAWSRNDARREQQAEGLDELRRLGIKLENGAK